MESKTRQKMPMSQRAKQFLPFQALPELSQALARQEKQTSPKPELSKDTARKLNQNMESIRRGTRAEVLYFQGGETTKITGVVSRIDETSRSLQIKDTIISFDQILWIQASP